MKRIVFQAMCAVSAMILCVSTRAQINTGSDGSDGAFNPKVSTNIDMSNHPNGIYQYSSINIPTGVSVTFTPNANNTPVIWLVQGNCVINGYVYVSGKDSTGTAGGVGGPGGYAGGSASVTKGSGPGAGVAAGGNASYGSKGTLNGNAASGAVYGNSFILPLFGGSGGAGGAGGGGGGGGAILIAAPNQVQLNGVVYALGGAAYGNSNPGAGGGSGGAVRIVATSIVGSGAVAADGGSGIYNGRYGQIAGQGRVRFDTLTANIAGISGTYSQGFQPIIIPAAGAGTQLSITSVAGVNVGANPRGLMTTPDLVIPAQAASTVAVVVQCSDIPINTAIGVFAVPTTGPAVQASGVNNAGTIAASTATINLNLPRGGGLIYAQAVTAVSGTSGASLNGGEKVKSYAQTGLTITGERFANMEVTAPLGGAQKITYITESKKRYVMPEN